MLLRDKFACVFQQTLAEKECRGRVVVEKRGPSTSDEKEMERREGKGREVARAKDPPSLNEPPSRGVDSLDCRGDVSCGRLFGSA